VVRPFICPVVVKLPTTLALSPGICAVVKAANCALVNVDELVEVNLVSALGGIELILAETDAPPNKVDTRVASSPMICFVVRAAYCELVRAAMSLVVRLANCEEESA